MNTLISTPFEWVGQGLLVALALGLALSAAAGALVILLPGAGFQLHRRSNPWAKTRDLRDTLARARRLERLFYRNHKLLGASMVAGAAYVLGSWMYAYDRMQVMHALAPRLQTLDGVVTWLESAALVIHLLVLLLGVVILARPRLVRGLLITGLGVRANPAYGTRSFGATLAHERRIMEQQLVLYPRLLGLVVLCGGTYAALALYPALLSVLSA